MMVALTGKNWANMCLNIHKTEKFLNLFYIRWYGSIAISFWPIIDGLAVKSWCLMCRCYLRPVVMRCAIMWSLFHAGEDTIWRRALARPGMTENKLAGILKTQMPASEKCQRADFVLDTDLSPEVTQQHLFSCLDDMPATFR
jgi:hypothetical protein